MRLRQLLMQEKFTVFSYDLMIHNGDNPSSKVAALANPPS